MSFKRDTVLGGVREEQCSVWQMEESVAERRTGGSCGADVVVLIGKLFIRRATAWPVPCLGRQSESSHLGSGAVLELPGLPLLLCVVK